MSILRVLGKKMVVIALKHCGNYMQHSVNLPFFCGVYLWVLYDFLDAELLFP
jgi:hypothetical protein